MALQEFLSACGVKESKETEHEVLAPGQWTVEKATQWQQKEGWLRGTNFVPSTAIKSL